MNLKSTIALQCTTGGAGGDSWLVHPRTNDATDTPQVRDIARRRMVKTNPDVDAAKVKKRKLKYKENSQTDENAFVGKPLRVQDTKYYHLVSEHDNESSAKTAMLARPYSRIIRHQEPVYSNYPKSRNAARKKVVNTNPDIP